MKIVVCGSMAFSQHMLDAKEILEKNGHVVDIPEGCEEYIGEKWENKIKSGWRPSVEGAQRKIDLNLIRKHYDKIKLGDVILVLNYDKNGIKNYIGGNSFLEMGFAHILNKKIYVLNPLPEELNVFYQELIAMQPKIINGDLKLIK